MNKFEGILLCTDLDGTLLRNDHTVSKENLDAIEYFKSEGGKFTFITGRMPFCAKDILEKIKPNAPIGCINGAGIYDFEAATYLWGQPLNPEALALARDAELEFPDIGIQVNTFKDIYFCKENSVMKSFREITKVPNKKRAFDDIKEKDSIVKIVFGESNEGTMQKLIEFLNSNPLANKFSFVRSESTLYEILPEYTNKGQVLPRLCDMLKISRDKTITVGDYTNDVEMISFAKLGVAVSNAHPTLKAIADHVTVSNEEHAIAKIIYDIDSGALTI